MTRRLTDAWARIGSAAADDAAALFDRLHGEGVPADGIVRALAMRITARNLAAGVDAEALARHQVAAWGLPLPEVPAAALSHWLDRNRLTDAMGTVVGRIDPGDESTVAVASRAVAKVASAESLESARSVFRAAVTGTGRVRGWVRQTEADACDLCQWWERDGKVWPVDHDMPTHPGCACAQEFVTE